MQFRCCCNCPASWSHPIVQLAGAEKHSYSIVDSSPDRSALLLAMDNYFETGNENFRYIQIAVMPLSTGEMHWINVWDLLSWKDCDATVEPQGFMPDGRIILRVRPSTMQPPRRPDCVAVAALYETNVPAGPASRLPDTTEVLRYGQQSHTVFQACKSDPDIVGECFVVHGALSIWNGTPGLRIRRIGTKRVLGIPSETLPETVASKIGFDITAYGDFNVCPLTRQRLGEMQMVCVESATHVLYQRQ